MYYLLVTFIAFVSILLQVSVLPFFNIHGVFPSIILIVAALWLIHINFQFAVTFSIVSGFFLDIFSQSFFGSHVLALVGTLFALKLIIDTYFQRENLVSTVFLEGIGVIIFTILLTLMNLLVSYLTPANYVVDFGYFFAFVIPLSVLWSVILTLLLFKPFKRLADVIQYFQHRAKNT